MRGFYSWLQSSNAADSTSAYLGGGRMFRHRRWAYGPTASLEYTDLHIHALDELGGAGALTVASQTARSLRTLVGGRLTREIPVRGGRIVPELRLRWAHEFEDDARPITSTLVGAPAAFTVSTGAPSRDSAYLGIGLNALVNRNAHAYVDYDGETSHGGLQTHTVSAGARFRF